MGGYEINKGPIGPLYFRLNDCSQLSSMSVHHVGVR